MSIFTGRTPIMNALYVPRLILFFLILVPLFGVITLVYWVVCRFTREEIEILKSTVIEVLKAIAKNEWNKGLTKKLPTS